MFVKGSLFCGQFTQTYSENVEYLLSFQSLLDQLRQVMKLPISVEQIATQIQICLSNTSWVHSED